jgi:hypothetical protein
MMGTQSEECRNGFCSYCESEECSCECHNEVGDLEDMDDYDRNDA